jgi:hypothetical protein
LETFDCIGNVDIEISNRLTFGSFWWLGFEIRRVAAHKAREGRTSPFSKQWSGRIWWWLERYKYSPLPPTDAPSSHPVSTVQQLSAHSFIFTCYLLRLFQLLPHTSSCVPPSSPLLCL